MNNQDEHEIEMYDDPWWTWENVLILTWRVFIIGWFTAFLAFLAGFIAGEWM